MNIGNDQAFLCCSGAFRSFNSPEGNQKRRQKDQTKAGYYYGYFYAFHTGRWQTKCSGSKFPHKISQNHRKA